METVKDAIGLSKKEQQGQEPVSGKQGEGNAVEPFDQGNQESDPSLAGKAPQQTTEEEKKAATSSGKSDNPHPITAAEILSKGVPSRSDDATKGYENRKLGLPDDELAAADTVVGPDVARSLAPNTAKEQVVQAPNTSDHPPTHPVVPSPRDTSTSQPVTSASSNSHLFCSSSMSHVNASASYVIGPAAHNDQDDSPSPSPEPHQPSPSILSEKKSGKQPERRQQHSPSRNSYWQRQSPPYQTPQQQEDYPSSPRQPWEQQQQSAPYQTPPPQQQQQYSSPQPKQEPPIRSSNHPAIPTAGGIPVGARAMEDRRQSRQVSYYSPSSTTDSTRDRRSTVGSSTIASSTVASSGVASDGTVASSTPATSTEGQQVAGEQQHRRRGSVLFAKIRRKVVRRGER